MPLKPKTSKLKAVRPRLGQHFLKDRGVIGKIIDAIHPQSGECIFEIGAGHGELTLPLAEACAVVGARVVAIEKDPLLASSVQRLAFSMKNFEIIHGDARTILPSITQNLTPSTYKIVGNIPYYLTGYLLRIVGDLPQKPARCVFMLQREVAERIVAKPPRMNKLAASVQFWSEPTIVATIPKKHFSPQPKVDSAIIRLEARSLEHETISATKNYYHAVKILFQQPRKTIANNLRADAKEETKDVLVKKLLALNIAPTDRPENLSRDDILRIAGAFFSTKI